jgi:hypothetical protein
MIKISFTKEDIEICTNFSKKVDTSLYINRNQFDENKRIIDSRNGKLGELITYYYLIDKYPNISYPDFNIYNIKDKSWDYDLKEDNFNLHVKTQEYLQSQKFGESWIFQNEDKHIFKTYNNNDYVSFVLLNYIQKFATIKAIVPVSLLHEKQLFKKTILNYLTTKSAVYFEDIIGMDFSL